MRLPLRLRLTLAFAACMAVLLFGVGSFLYLRLAQELRQTTDAALGVHADVVITGLDEGGGNFGDRGSSAGGISTFAQLLDADGVVVESSDAVSATRLALPSDFSRLTEPTFAQRSIPGVGIARLLIEPINERGSVRFLIVGSSLESQQVILTRFLLMLVLGGPAALALASVIGWWIAGTALRPVEAVRQEAAAFSESDLTRRLPVPTTGDELARLVVTLNTMLGRLQSAFERERRFVDDASHELRTPLTLLKTELDLARARARTPQQMEGALSSASEEADRLAALAEDLLVYSRSDEGRVPLYRTDVRLDELLRSACTAFSERALSAHVQIRLECPAELVVHVDAARIRQTADNLLANAIHHTPPNGRVRVAADMHGGGIRLEVDDTGDGFRPEFIERAFEPFARDASERAGAVTGSGLGLAIVRAIAEAHGGTATATNLRNGGARITITLTVGTASMTQPRTPSGSLTVDSPPSNAPTRKLGTDRGREVTR